MPEPSTQPEPLSPPDAPKYSLDNVISAIESWLEFGESSLGCCHKGYFSAKLCGWSADVLNAHLVALKRDLRETESDDA